MKIKRIVISYCLVLLAMMLTEVLLAQSIASTFTLSSGIYPGAPDLTVWKEDSTYYSKNAYGSLSYSSTNASYVVNTYLNSLDKTRLDLKTIALKGALTFTAPIILHNRTILDLRDATITMAAGFDDSLIKNWWGIYGTGATYYDNDIRILGGKINGGKAGQASGGIIEFFNASEVRIEDGFYWKGKDFNINLTYVYRSHINAIVMESDGDGLYLNTVAQLTGTLKSFGNNVGLYMTGCGQVYLSGSIYQSLTDGAIILGESWGSSLDISVTYSGESGIRLVQSKGVHLKGSSSFNDEHGIKMEDANYTTLNGFYSRSNSQAVATTYDDIFLTDYGVSGYGCFYNVLSIIADSTDTAWNVEEGGTSDYNIIHDSFTFSATGIKVIGAHTHISASFNGTGTWISESP